jgi:hypothetical protein
MVEVAYEMHGFPEPEKGEGLASSLSQVLGAPRFLICAGPGGLVVHTARAAVLVTASELLYFHAPRQATFTCLRAETRAGGSPKPVPLISPLWLCVARGPDGWELRVGLRGGESAVFPLDEGVAAPASPSEPVPDSLYRAIQDVRSPASRGVRLVMSMAEVPKQEGRVPVNFSVGDGGPSLEIAGRAVPLITFHAPRAIFRGFDVPGSALAEARAYGKGAGALCYVPGRGELGAVLYLRTRHALVLLGP